MSRPPGSALRLARGIARWLDGRYLDPVLGLVLPEVGDLVTTAFGLYVVVVALLERVPLPVVARMVLNLGIDALVGAVPVVGDVFDFVFKAHTRNLALLEARLPARQATASDWGVLVVAVGLLVVGCATAVMLAVQLLRWLV